MTTKQDIEKWFDEGVNQKAKYLLVVVDTFDWEDYPVLAYTADDCLRKFKHPGDMQKIMEVYDLSLDKQTQLNAHRAMNLP